MALEISCSQAFNKRPEFLDVQPGWRQLDEDEEVVVVGGSGNSYSRKTPDFFARTRTSSTVFRHAMQRAKKDGKAGGVGFAPMNDPPEEEVSLRFPPRSKELRGGLGLVPAPPKVALFLAVQSAKVD